MSFLQPSFHGLYVPPPSGAPVFEPPMTNLQVWLKSQTLDDDFVNNDPIMLWANSGVGGSSFDALSVNSNDPVVHTSYANGRAAVYFDYTLAPHFNLGDLSVIGNNLHVFVVLAVAVQPPGEARSLWEPVAALASYPTSKSGGLISEVFGVLGPSLTLTPAISLTDLHLYEIRSLNDGTWEARQNGSGVGSAPFGGATLGTNFYLGGSPTYSQYFDGGIVEFLLYNDDQETNLAEIYGYLNNMFALGLPV